MVFLIACSLHVRTRRGFHIIDLINKRVKTFRSLMPSSSRRWTQLEGLRSFLINEADTISIPIQECLARHEQGTVFSPGAILEIYRSSLASRPSARTRVPRTSCMSPDRQHWVSPRTASSILSSDAFVFGMKAHGWNWKTSG